MTTDPHSGMNAEMPQDPDASMRPENATESDATTSDGDSSADARKPRILIGSQRDPGAPLPKKRDWYVPGEKKDGEPAAPAVEASSAPPQLPETTPPTVESSDSLAMPEPHAATFDSEPVTSAASSESESVSESVSPSGENAETIGSVDASCSQPELPESALSEPALSEPVMSEPVDLLLNESKHFPPPNIREQLSPELERELEAALGDASLEDLMSGGEAVTSGVTLEAESKQQGRVVAVHREDVFIELGSREQGLVPLKQFAETPEPGVEVTVAVVRFNQEDGLYELRLPGSAASVGDWSDIEEGSVIEVRVTGHNTGGLECEVNHIRGFIPVSQISLYRVEDLAQFVGEKMTCVVTEANPERRNLVLSRRALLEREREESRVELLESLAPGQTREGVVRKLMDFGAFVDLGGVDGLLHVSELGWGRVNHANEVLTEGQTIKVKVLKIDKDSRRISLGYRDMLENPWNDVDHKFPINTQVKGTVVKIMEFGAFVQLEPGIEGLVHISELDHKRVWRVSDVVKEGQEVDVMVKAIDKEKQRISLSIKDTIARVEPEKKGEQTEEELAAAMPAASKRQSNKPLQGGLGRVSGGDKFGLNW